MKLKTNKIYNFKT